MHSPFRRLFPTPSFVMIPAAGIDFSDATMRFMELTESLHGFEPKRFAEFSIPEGCMKGGRIVDEAAFTAFLRSVQEKHTLKYVRVAIPESQTYSFTLPLDIAASDDIRSAIELVIEDNIPLRAPETVFDYNILSSTDRTIMVQVVAMAEMVATSFFNCFMSAGLYPVSFELDGQAIARAVLSPKDTGSNMIVDFGANRTEITIVTNGTAVFTSTLEFGGKMLLNLLMKELGVPIEEAYMLKREYGLTTVGEHKNIFDILSGGIATLKDEINRRYIYWHEKKDQLGNFPAIETIYLCGGHSNMKGLADYLSAALKVKTVQVNPWVNCMDFDDAIPTVPFETSMSYVTAIGLSLAEYRYD